MPTNLILNTVEKKKGHFLVECLLGGYSELGSKNVPAPVYVLFFSDAGESCSCDNYIKHHLGRKLKTAAGERILT